jgi:DNA-binding transcriptional regulator/RsmH inhibitor MraZ
MEFAGLDKECTIICFGPRIEIWAKAQYDLKLTTEPKDYSAMMDEVKDVLANMPYDTGHTTG